MGSPLIHESRYYSLTGFGRPVSPVPRVGPLTTSSHRTLHRNLNSTHWWGGTSSRSLELGLGDLAKDAGSPRAPPSRCPSSRAPACLCHGRLGWPSALRIPPASLAHLLLAASLVLPAVLQAEVTQVQPPASGLGRCPGFPREECKVPLTQDREGIKNSSHFWSQAQGRCFPVLSSVSSCSHAWKTRHSMTEVMWLGGGRRGV